MWDVWETREVHTVFWWGNVAGRHNLADLSICGTIIIKLILKKWYGEEGSGSLWLRIGTGWQVLVNAVMKFGVPKNACLV